MDERMNLFEEKRIRRLWHKDELYFCVRDVVQILTDTKNVKGYIKDMRRTNKALDDIWDSIVLFLDVPESEKVVRKLNCANLRGIVLIIKSIPAAKAKAYQKFLGVA